MKKRTSHYAWATRFGLCMLLVLGLMVPALDAFAQQTPLTFDQILGLIEEDVDETELVKQIEKYTVDFGLTRENMQALIRAGAPDALLDAIENNRFHDLIIMSPRDGDECSRILRVEGRSVAVAGRHLWLFAHRRGLSVWWPQGGEVLVEDDGSWMQSSFLGNAADVGFKFEVKVMWVDEDVHTQMEDYLHRGESAQYFPGIRLPEGSPVAEVTCKKVSH